MLNWFARNTCRVTANVRNKQNVIESAREDIVNCTCASLTTSGAKYNTTVEAELKKWFKVFKENNISEPLESIANILAHTLHTNNISEVHAKKSTKLNTEQLLNISQMCKMRLQSMPVQYVIGQWDFRELTLTMRPPVFIPRPETEMLVELALQDIKERNIKRALEFCSGSGAISLALLNQIKDLEIVAVEKSEAACQLSRENAKQLNLDSRFVVHQAEVSAASTLGSITPGFDVIISNPPYVLTEDMRTLQPEILLYEDLDALEGGDDGLRVVEQIFAVSSAFLNPAGKLFLEVDPSHPPLMRDKPAPGLRLLRIHQDLFGVDRFVELIKD